MVIDGNVAERLEKVGIRPGTYALRPISRLEHYIADRLTTSSRDIPAFPLTYRIEVDRLVAHRKALAHDGKAGFTLNDMLIKAAALAMKAVPDVNRSFTDEGMVSHNCVDIAVAVAARSGLITPIVRNADISTLTEIAGTMRDLAERAGQRKLLPDEYTGGGFTISNLGMFGISSFASIINPPQAAILSVGSIEQQLRHGDAGIETVQTLTVTLTCDHRVIDGVTGARWLKAFDQAIADPATL